MKGEKKHIQIQDNKMFKNILFAKGNLPWLLNILSTRFVFILFFSLSFWRCKQRMALILLAFRSYTAKRHLYEYRQGDKTNVLSGKLAVFSKEVFTKKKK